MKAYISTNGTLYVVAESTTEGYALAQWSEHSRVTVQISDPTRAISVGEQHWDSRKLTIGVGVFRNEVAA